MFLVISFYLSLLTNVLQIVSNFVPSTYFCLWRSSLGIVLSLTLSILSGGGCIVTDCPLVEPVRRLFMMMPVEIN